MSARLDNGKGKAKGEATIDLLSYITTLLPLLEFVIVVALLSSGYSNAEDWQAITAAAAFGIFMVLFHLQTTFIKISNWGKK